MRPYSRFYGWIKGEYGDATTRKGNEGMEAVVQDNKVGIRIEGVPVEDKFRPGLNVFKVYLTPGSDHGTYKGYNPLDEVLVGEFSYKDLIDGVRFEVRKVIEE